MASLAALGAADLDDHVLVVVGILREQELTKPIIELDDQRLGGLDLLAQHVAIVPGCVGEHLLGGGDVLVCLPKAADALDDLLELVVPLGGPGVRALVGDQVGIAEPALQILVLALELVVDIGHRPQATGERNLSHLPLRWSGTGWAGWSGGSGLRPGVGDRGEGGRDGEADGHPADDVVVVPFGQDQDDLVRREVPDVGCCHRDEVQVDARAADHQHLRRASAASRRHGSLLVNARPRLEGSLELERIETQQRRIGHHQAAEPTFPRDPVQRMRPRRRTAGGAAPR